MTEAGIVLMGLDATRLLAGLGLAAPADDDPGQVALAIDRVQHGVAGAPSVEDLLAAGRRRWEDACRALDTADWTTPRSADLRETWSQALTLVTAANLTMTGPAIRAYLAACLLRRDGLDRCAAALST